MEVQRKKAQSAMEYLMTYGWAILIIAVVLVALFSLGVFKPSVSNSCVGQPGFICQNAAYSHTTGNIIVTIGQATGTNWVTPIYIEFVPQGTGFISNLPPFNSVDYNSLSSGLTSGGTTTVTLGVGTLTAASPSIFAGTGAVAAGTTVSGQIWAEYTVGSTTYYVEMASLNLAAT